MLAALTCHALLRCALLCCEGFPLWAWAEVTCTPGMGDERIRSARLRTRCPSLLRLAQRAQSSAHDTCASPAPRSAETLFPENAHTSSPGGLSGAPQGRRRPAPHLLTLDPAPCTQSLTSTHLKSGLAFRCSTRATSSCTPPLAALTRTASGFIMLSRSAFIRCFVCSSSAQCRLTTCQGGAPQPALRRWLHAQARQTQTAAWPVRDWAQHARTVSWLWPSRTCWRLWMLCQALQAGYQTACKRRVWLNTPAAGAASVGSLRMTGTWPCAVAQP